MPKSISRFSKRSNLSEFSFSGIFRQTGSGGFTNEADASDDSTNKQTLSDFQKARDFRTFCKTATAKTIFFTRRRRLLILSSFLVMNSDAKSITRSLSRQFFLGLWKSVMLRNELKIKQFPWKLSLKVRSFLFWSLDKIILGMMDFFVRNMRKNNQQE